MPIIPSDTNLQKFSKTDVFPPCFCLNESLFQIQLESTVLALQTQV